MMTAVAPLTSSFRDPSGFLFSRDGVLYRQVNAVCQPDYDQLMASGLYAALVADGLLIPHDEVEVAPAEPALAYRVLQPERVPTISYPYEWCFSQLQDAALLTLQVQKRAMACGMTLKDASTYNVQFHRGKPIFIDTLSFARRPEGQPWVAYRQFCQHFLAPLALMARRDVRLGQLLRVHLDGIPLDLASALLPNRTRWQPSLALHLHLHARMQRRYADAGAGAQNGRQMSDFALLGLLDSLEGAVRGQRWQPRGTEWADYYTDTNYSQEAASEKARLVAGFLEALQPATVWDLGANTGVYSRLASERGIATVAWDIDPAAVERAYRDGKARGDAHLLPLLQDLTNPSPGLGWAHAERDAFLARGPVDVALALALVHHLAIGNNVPLPQVAAFFAGLCRTLIIEFVPKEDSQVSRLLVTREDIFTDYTQEAFEQAFAAYFTQQEAVRVGDSLRTLYVFRRRE